MVVLTEIIIDGVEYVAYRHSYGIIVSHLDYDYSVLIGYEDISALYIEAFNKYGLELRSDGKGIVVSSGNLYDLDLLKGVAVYKYIGF